MAYFLCQKKDKLEFHEVRGGICRGVLHTPKNKFVANDVGAGPVSAPTIIMIFKSHMQYIFVNSSMSSGRRGLRPLQCLHYFL